MGLIAVPYAAVDLTAFRWALGGHLLDRGEPLLLVQEIYEAFGASAPAWLNALDNRYVGLANALFAILVMFDPSHRRALAKAGLFYILTLPVIHVRYLLFGWAALFLFAAPPPPPPALSRPRPALGHCGYPPPLAPRHILSRVRGAVLHQRASHGNRAG